MGVERSRLKNTRKKLTIALALAAVIWSLGSVEQAQAVSAISQFFTTAENRLTGINAEYMINRSNAGGMCGAATGTPTPCVDVGDLFIGIFNVNQVFDITNGGSPRTLGANGVNELTGVFALKVLTQDSIPVPLLHTTFLTETLGPVSSTDITNAVSAGQMSAALGAFFTTRQSMFPGTIISIFDDSTVDWTDVYTPAYPKGAADDDCDLARNGSDAGIPTTVARCFKTEERLLASAIGGILRFHLGFTGLDTDGDTQPNPNGVGEGLSTVDQSAMPTNPRNIQALKAIPVTSPVGDVAGGFNLTHNFTNLQFGQVLTVDTTPLQQFFGTANFGFSGQDKGGRENGPFDLTSSEVITFQIQAVPEPSTLTLMFLGVAGLGCSAAIRRKMRK